MSSKAQIIRQSNLDILQKKGFSAADGLPLMPEANIPGEPGSLGGMMRPAIEIANRYLALFGVFAWGSAPEPMEGVIAHFIQLNELHGAMTEDELAIIELPKKQAMEEHQGTVGWKLENMWALGWILELTSSPTIDSGQIPTKITDEIMAVFMPKFEVNANTLLIDRETQPNENIVIVHDLFYCAHNAVRSAQLGNPSVPDGFDPVAEGGAIQERRHALTWSLCPGVAWNETPLDT